jgi:hypothetical protein
MNRPDSNAIGTALYNFHVVLQVQAFFPELHTRPRPFVIEMLDTELQPPVVSSAVCGVVVQQS